MLFLASIMKIGQLMLIILMADRHMQLPNRFLKKEVFRTLKI